MCDQGGIEPELLVTASCVTISFLRVASSTEASGTTILMPAFTMISTDSAWLAAMAVRQPPILEAQRSVTTFCRSGPSFFQNASLTIGMYWAKNC